MKKLLLVISFLTTLTMASAHAAESLSTDFIDSTGKKIGTAMLQELEKGLLITVDLQLPAGVHALHIHQNDKCDVPDFKTAGGHLNPEGHKHGFASPEGFHSGDLPNLYVESTGHIKTEMFAKDLHLSGVGGLGSGVSFVVHAKADDYSSDPAGNSGDRIACAVVKK